MLYVSPNVLEKVQQTGTSRTSQKWSIEKDQPLVNSYDIIKEFDVEAVVNSDGTWDFFEIVKVDNIKAFEELMETDIFKKE